MRVLVQNAEIPEKQAWFQLPIGEPNQYMEETYRLIHIGRKADGYMSKLLIADVESDIPNLKKYISPYSSLESLDRLELEIQKMTSEEKSKFTQQLNNLKPKAVEDVIKLARETITPTMAFNFM